MDYTRLQELIQRYNKNECSPEEKRWLEQWYQSFDWEASQYSNQEHITELKHAAWAAILQQKPGNQEEQVKITPHRKLFRISLSRAIAAAVIVFVLGSASYFLFFNKHEKQPVASQADRFKNDIAPGSSKAVLTLANGERIILDSASEGVLATQGNARVIKHGSGEISYTGPGGNQTAVFYNTVSTPRGGEYAIVLPDGSRVWLNAASSLYYPTAFAGKERHVELMGEAYFEIAHNAKMPFTVGVGNTSVQVLGTHFNIKAYPDEPALETTLLEGSISITHGHDSKRLSPGQQARIDNKDAMLIINQADTGKVMAWRQNRFVFSGDDIGSVMRQIGRWYNADITYEGSPEEKHFSGIVNRNNKLSAVLSMLELTGKIHFRIESKKIIVMP